MDRQCNVPATYVRGRLSRPVARNGYYLRRVRTVSGREPLIAVRICTWNHGATYGEAALKVQCARKNVSKLGGVGGRAGRQREDRDRRGYNSEPRRAHLLSSPPSDRPRAGRGALPTESLSRPHGAEEQSEERETVHASTEDRETSCEERPLPGESAHGVRPRAARYRPNLHLESRSYLRGGSCESPIRRKEPHTPSYCFSVRNQFTLANPRVGAKRTR